MQPAILVTGGAGYIGSHACLALLEAGYRVAVVDNLCNSRRASLERVRELGGRTLTFDPIDLRDAAGLERVFDAQGPFDAVIHFAGLKAVGESVTEPLAYYQNNITGTLTLIDVMQRKGCRTMVFSSSATVYGNPKRVPIPESAPVNAVNPYGRTKLMIEEILGDLQAAEPDWRIARLRYFNPVGAHPSGQIGEDPSGTPNNLVPYIAQVAVGRRSCLRIFGRDYPTPDGTGIRDYIHVMDLVEGHLRALDALKRPEVPGLLTLNLGTGRGYSVLEVLRAFENACGKHLAHRFVPRRPGDAAICFADPALAFRMLDGWRAQRDLDAMCADTWRWQQQHPNGYAPD